MYNFRQTLLAIPDLTLCLHDAHKCDDFNIKIDQTYADDIVVLLRELLHQMFGRRGLYWM